MKLKGLTTILATSALAGGVALLSNVDNTDVASQRVAKLSAKPVDARAVCPGGATKVSDGYLCVTNKKGSLINEQPEGDRWIAFCPVAEGKATHNEVRSGSGPVPIGCVPIAEDLLFTHAQANVETDLTERMRELCAPCVVTPTQWGPCPHCLSWPGGCKSACPVKVGVP